MADLPELQETHNWRAPRARLLAALKARAEGEEWRAPPGDYWTTDAIQAETDRLERETGLSAAELAARLRADIERIAAAEARITQAEADLRDAAKDRMVVAEGRPASRPDDPRDEIPARWFDEKRRIGLDGKLEGPGGVEWVDVQFRTTDVQKVLLEGRDLATGAQPEERAEVSRFRPPLRAPADAGGFAGSAASAGGAPAVRHRFSEGTLGGWFMLRVSTWPEDAAPPSEADDLTAARAYFDDVPRDVFRKIRRQKTPPNWRKSGPRRAGGK